MEERPFLCDLFSTPADLDRKTEERVQVQSDKIQKVMSTAEREQESYSM